MDNPSITRKVAMEVIQMQKSKTFEILNGLLEAGLIESRGKGRGTHYILKDKGVEKI